MGDERDRAEIAEQVLREASDKIEISMQDFFHRFEAFQEEVRRELRRMDIGLKVGIVTAIGVLVKLFFPNLGVPTI